MEATCEFVTRFSINQAEEISQLRPDNERRDVIEREREREKQGEIAHVWLATKCIGSGRVKVPWHATQFH